MKASESSTQPERGTARSAIHAITNVSSTMIVADIAASSTLVFTASTKIG